MTEKELDKSLNKDVKPGQEQIAINTAQTQANQLLTEQRMNLQSERQMMTSNSERDTELRGAIELGAMNAAQPQQVVQQALPPQAAGLRPETQQLLAKYGVNPTITESARTTSNTSQSKSANSKMQVVPNSQGGDTRVTNTTNITNITNNNSRVETKVDAKQPAVLPQAQPARLAPVPVSAGGVAAGGAMLGFKNFLNNLFAKRDHERQLQEREYRRRDWSIQRMSRKVLERMDSISQKFASKMNPEKVGSTFMGQIKLFLSMVGLTLLPKLWPAIIKGIDGISGFLNDIKTAWTSENGGIVSKLGSVFSVVGNKIVDGVMSLGGTIVGSLKSIADTIAIKLRDTLAGDEYTPEEKDKKGVLGILGDKLVKFFGGNHKEITFPQMLKSYFSTLAKDIRNIFDVMAEDRAVAIKTVWERDKDASIFSKEGSLTSITRLLNNFPALLAAAIGGHRGLQMQSLYNAQQKSKEDLLENGSMENGKHYDKFTGKIKNVEGTKFMAENLAKVHDNEYTNSITHAEGIKKLYEFSDRTNNSISITYEALEKLLNKVSISKEDKSRLTEEINHAIDKKVIKPIAEKGIKTRFVTATETDKVIEPTGRIVYSITKDAVPTFLALLSGQSEGITFKADDGNLDELLKRNKEYLESILYDNYKGYIQNIDKQFMKKSGVSKSSLESYNYIDAMEKADQYSDQLDRAIYKLYDDTGLDTVVDYAKSIGTIPSEKIDIYNQKQDEYYFKTHDFLNNGNVWSKLGDVTVDAFKKTRDGLMGTASKAGNMLSNAVDYAANKAPMGAVAADNVAAGQTDSPLTGDYAKKQTLAGVNTNVPDGTPTQQKQTPKVTIKTEDQLNAEADAAGLTGQAKIAYVNEKLATQAEYQKSSESENLAIKEHVEKSRSKRKVTEKDDIKGNNPGNIKNSDLNGFAGYESLSDGYTAMFNKLLSWFNKAPKTERAYQLKTEDGQVVADNPANTINKFIRIWAPGSDNNNEESYVSFVESYTGINRDTVINPNDSASMKAIAEAMTIMEHLGGRVPNSEMLAAIDKGWENRGVKVQQVEYADGTISKINVEDSGNPFNSGWYNELISFFESMFGDKPAAESANPAQADTGTSLGDTSTSMPSTPKAELADNQSTSVPTANVKGEVIPQSSPKTEIAKAPGAEELADNEAKTEAQAPVWAPTDASTHHTDNSQVVNNYNIVSDNALHSLTVHGRNLHSNHS